MISIFTTATNPIERGDPFNQAVECYSDLADEVIVVNGEDPETLWPYEFDWPLIGQQFQKGYELCSGDWVIHCDLDFIFHERDYGRIHQALRDYPNAPAVSFYKWQFILPDRYNLKSRLVLAVNKGKFGDRIKFNGSGDLCQPTLDGQDINIDEIPQAGIPFYNYEHTFKTKEQIEEDIGRMDRAWQRHFGRTLYSNDELTAYEGWYNMMSGRFNKPSKSIQLHEHPKVMQESISKLKPSQFGYNGFGLIKGKVYA